jgi:ANTAR domain-containing protein/PAS domain-containing protein
MTSTLNRSSLPAAAAGTRRAPRPAAPALAPRPSSAPTGVPLSARFRCSPAADAWWWSPEMYELHGVPCDGTPPRARLLLDLLHPADRQRARAALAGCADRLPFALETRVTRPDGQVRTVVLTGEPVLDDLGRVAAVEGICVDVTAGRRSSESERVQELETEVAQLRTAMASRAAIEQAKGILMLLTGCGEKPAFELLTHISSHTHRKVREVATALTASAAGHGRLPDDIAAILHDACPPGGAPR